MTMDVPKNDVNLDELEEEFKDFLYRHNGKVTPERMAILRALYRTDGHFSVEDILSLAEQEDVNVSRATVYRTLDLLAESGLAKRHAFQGQETLYESTLNTGHHDHVICMDCKQITEFFNPELEKLQTQILKELEMDHVHHVHQLYARCLKQNCPNRPESKVRNL